MEKLRLVDHWLVGTRTPFLIYSNEPSSTFAILRLVGMIYTRY